MASKVSKDKLFNLQSNPNLDAADTGVDPSTGRYLSNRERIAIFKKRKIDVKRVFGKRTDLSKFGAIVKAPKPMGVEDRIADIEKTLIFLSKDNIIDFLNLNIKVLATTANMVRVPVHKNQKQFILKNSNHPSFVPIPK